MLGLTTVAAGGSPLTFFLGRASGCRSRSFERRLEVRFRWGEDEKAAKFTIHVTSELNLRRTYDQRTRRLPDWCLGAKPESLHCINAST
jgi:hypothetical protein